MPRACKASEVNGESRQRTQQPKRVALPPHAHKAGCEGGLGCLGRRFKGRPLLRGTDCLQWAGTVLFLFTPIGMLGTNGPTELVAHGYGRNAAVARVPANAALVHLVGSFADNGTDDVTSVRTSIDNPLQAPDCHAGPCLAGDGIKVGNHAIPAGAWRRHLARRSLQHRYWCRPCSHLPLQFCSDLHT